eukprot:s2930_g6.t1
MWTMNLDDAFYQMDCKVELQADEPRACEQRWVNWCQDECRAHYGDNKKAVYKGHDKWLCYNDTDTFM